jgi:enamine deaminase RidA (YjgF/YER057c/UK114 family)
VSTSRPPSRDADARLLELGIVLPAPPQPAANYLPFRRAGDLLFIAGQVPFVDGGLPLLGKLGEGVTVAQGKEQARIATLNAVSIAAAANSGLRGLTIVQLMVFVASSPQFIEQHIVANGASDILVDIFGVAGQHARTAIAVPCLPLDAPVEVQMTFLVEAANGGG